MAESFLVQYPLFIISKEADMALIEVRNSADTMRLFGLAVFTDHDAVLEWRDKHNPGWEIGEIEDERYFDALLRAIQDRVSLVVFDPYKIDKHVHSIGIEAMIDQLEVS